MQSFEIFEKAKQCVFEVAENLHEFEPILNEKY
jgi:hypothetical protein